jgi:hypothetical protein
VGERVGDDEVVSPHHADAELPDHLLRRHGADGFCRRILGLEQGDGIRGEN